MDDCIAVVLAAGKGSRMKSNLPKVLHPLAGRPMARYVIEAAREAGCVRIVVVVGHEGQKVRERLGEDVEYVVQTSQLGTGHAVLQARDMLRGWSGDLLVMVGDTPLIRPHTLANLFSRHRLSGAAVTVLTGLGGYREGAGRIKRDSNGLVTDIVEEKEATEAERQITEWNTGVYCLRAPWLWGVLDELPVHSDGEYYLTDVVRAAASGGARLEAVGLQDVGECLGINSRAELSLAEGVLRQRIRERLMLEGVTLMDPATTFIDNEVQIEPDTVVYPNTFLQGKTRIGRGCVIGPNTQIAASTIGDGCTVLSSMVEDAILESGVDVGPFSHVRAGVYLETGVHVGNFVELKKSHLGRGTKVGHFSYVGDAQVGRDVNIGAGTITANYDGKTKHQTIIEDGVFIGSGSTLVAPVHVGSDAITGAGSVVTKDVPSGALAYGVPARVQPRKRTKGE
ncbi:MAG: bifunctional UDP-N-acetylglucosamine diphosphorylase/glucosamine-1-phosphate N-acetyltransferase GlmU [Dehalococcoidia bacterium]|nr:bifunctional UDP-N-acetylglucosamine diphosphorylase/glucosamine-1-phosphate N-acetyltransferase GlmU [Dehalococcoidia bacterium]